MSTIYLELATVKPSRMPNNWLVAPRSVVAAKPDQTAPVFDHSAGQVAKAWLEVIERQPRTAVLGISGDGLQIEAEQRSALFGFIDRISTRFVPLESGRSTVIAYSRSLLGFWDLGVNRSRLRRWLSDLTEQLGRSAGPSR